MFKYLPYLYAFGLIFFITQPALASTILYAEMASIDVNESIELGNLEIKDLGKVVFSAVRNKKQIFIDALDQKGRKVGRAETVIGVKETPIFLITTSGLEKVIIKWEKAPKITPQK